MLAVPEPQAPLVSLTEEDPLSLAPTYFPMDAVGLLSDVEPFESVAVGLPPRVVDASLLKSMRQVGAAGGPGRVSGCMVAASRGDGLRTCWTTGLGMRC